ncbi:MAG: methyl-accepting chemotaxis sensory transducer [Solirubrobacterales bacterium]|jgi:hypothetical protein|nr:methyl-accepting chemotaxis sensory transducer [Solirubrobacterales bacterium]
MTIRAKLYAAIVLTILGPLATTAVALNAMSDLGGSFDEVKERGRHESLALEVKFDVTDMNGWQTAYGYAGDGRFRPEFVRSATVLDSELARAERELTDATERTLVSQLRREYERFMALDAVAFSALRQGDAARVKRIFLGPELLRFEAMATTASKLAAYQFEQAQAADAAFDDDREDARKQLIAVALGAGIVIILLLVTAQDVVRMALEGERRSRGEPGDEKPS